MSSLDGAQVVRVDVEHLPDRRYRLWLGEPYPRTDLGTVDRTAELGPESMRRVGEQLGLEPGSYYAELEIPQPDYVVDGGRVVVVDPRDGREVAGTVIAWINGEVWVDCGADIAGGMYAPEDVTFLVEDRQDPGR
jgi:hypothetical protein